MIFQEPHYLEPSLSRPAWLGGGGGHQLGPELFPHFPAPGPAPAHPGLLINIIPVIALLRPARPARPSWRKLAGWAEQVWWPTVEG